MKFAQEKSLIILAFASVIIFLIIYVIGTSFFELKSYNFLVKTIAQNSKASDDILLVVIDDKSLHQIGRWPWRRTRYGEIFEYLSNHTQAKQIGYDAIIVAPDIEHPESDKKFFNDIKNYDKLSAGVGFLNNEFKNANKNLYENLLFKKNKIIIEDQRSKKYKNPSSYKSFSAFQKDYLKNIKNKLHFIYKYAILKLHLKKMHVI